jgi:hypothetical protein
MIGAKVALRPENEAPRKTWQGPRGTTNYFINSRTVDTTIALRLQRLSASCGVDGTRADLLAKLIWGEAA